MEWRKSRGEKKNSDNSDTEELKNSAYKTKSKSKSSIKHTKEDQKCHRHSLKDRQLNTRTSCPEYSEFLTTENTQIRSFDLHPKRVL